MHYRALFFFHAFYFMVYSATTFLPKYFGELGMTDSQIGMLISLPAIAGVLLQPLFGALTDRARLKKYVVLGLLAALSLICFAMNRSVGFAALLLGMTLFNILQLPIAPAYSAISLEYTRQIGKPYGPVRVMGVFGYQGGLLLIGLILRNSLRGLYALLGVVLLVTAATACFLPPIAGHQYGRPRIKMRTLLADRHLRALFGMVLIGAITNQYYLTFFSKHLGDLNINNTMSSLIIIASVLLEIPFLIFGDRLARRMSIWNWLLLSYGLGAVRWIGLALSRSVPLLLLFQIPAVTAMACFEFLPALYVGRRAEDALQASAQTALTIVSFGISKIIGGLLGGFISDVVGIPAVFLFNGAMLAVAAVLLWRHTRRLIETDSVDYASPPPGD